LEAYQISLYSLGIYRDIIIGKRVLRPLVVTSNLKYRLKVVIKAMLAKYITVMVIASSIEEFDDFIAFEIEQVNSS
jgi:hypothetical protein